jgi:protein TonB
MMTTAAFLANSPLTRTAMRMPRLPRNVVIVAGVVLFHVGLLWALQSGLLRRAVETIVPVTILTELVTPPVPIVEPPPKLKPPQPAPQPVVKRKTVPTPPPAPQLVASPELPPAPNAPTGVVEAPAPLPPIAAPVAVAAPPPPPPPARVELPSSDADYLQNPRPAYPAISRRMGEQGKVVIRVLIGVDGKAQQAELQQSSGYERLDQAALETVRRWRYVPGKRAGVPEAMWFNVPITYVLEK